MSGQEQAKCTYLSYRMFMSDTGLPKYMEAQCGLNANPHPCMVDPSADCVNCEHYVDADLLFLKQMRASRKFADLVAKRMEEE